MNVKGKAHLYLTFSALAEDLILPFSLKLYVIRLEILTHLMSSLTETRKLSGCLGFCLICDNWCICSNCKKKIVRADFKYSTRSSSKSFRSLLRHPLCHYLCTSISYARSLFLTTSWLLHFGNLFLAVRFSHSFLYITADTANWLTLFHLF